MCIYVNDTCVCNVLYISNKKYENTHNLLSSLYFLDHPHHWYTWIFNFYFLEDLINIYINKENDQ